MKEMRSSEPETAADWSKHISEFAFRWEFGTPEFLAISDFNAVCELYGQIGKEPHTFVAKASGETNLSPEQRENLTLQRIALLEHTILQNQSRVPRYASAYVEIYSSFNSMIEAASQEALAKFPDQEEKKTEYIQEIYGLASDFVSDAIYAKQELNLHSR